jgi:hypothetical protein
MGRANRAVAMGLRSLVKDRLSIMEPEVFLDFMITLEADERVQGADWPEGWSPQQELRRAGFQTLLDAENVRAVSANEDGRPEDIIIIFRQDGRDEVWPLTGGRDKLAELKRTVSEHFAELGNNHWGTTTDIAMLAEALNIGFIVFGSHVLGSGHWIHGLNLERADFPFWILLYNAGAVHFQLAEVSSQAAAEPPRSAFTTGDIPRGLAQHYNLCNEKHIGQGSSGGVS